MTNGDGATDGLEERQLQGGGAPRHQRFPEFEFNQAAQANRYFKVRTTPAVPVRLPDHERINAIFSVSQVWPLILSGRLRSGDQIAIEAQLTEWLPLSPGRYFTPHARRARHSARYDEILCEYTLGGKASMLEGGLGTLRVASKALIANAFVLVGATSERDAAAGIPVRLPLDLYEEIKLAMRQDGVVAAKLSGSLVAVDRAELAFRTDHRVPNIIFDATRMEVERSHHMTRQPTMASVAIAFAEEQIIDRLSHQRGEEQLWRPGNGVRYSFASFDVSRGSEGIASACDWLEAYIGRHSERADRQMIVSDFDDSTQWFNRQVMLPLSALRGGIFTQDALANSKRYWSAVARDVPVFLSYRHRDAEMQIDAHVGMVYEFLKHESAIPAAFWDKRDIRAGDRWKDVLETEVCRSAAVLAFIGPNWERHLPDPNSSNSTDWVHQELRWALQAGVRILPILLGGRKLETVKFPEDLESIKDLQPCILEPSRFEATKQTIRRFLADHFR